MSKHNATSAADIKPAQPYGMSQRLHHANGARPPVTTYEEDQARFFMLAENGQAAMLDVFLEQKGPAFNINMCNDEGETALHVAARNGKIQSCKILLRRGAEIMPNAHAKTPYDVAVANGQNYCASMLRAKLDGTFAVGELGQYSTRDSGVSRDTASHTSTLIAGNYRQAERSSTGGDATAQQLETHTAALATLQPPVQPDMPPSSNAASYNISSPRSSDAKRVLTIVRALYNYKASEELPFPPDERPELTLTKGESLDLIHMREDGWCIVRRTTGPLQEGFAPGNYMTDNGRDSMVKQYLTNGDTRSRIGSAK
eukprot:GHVU01165965.1.p1 GENE.GHVU01165965.1~~GHVU01165965.1.p1  ORF type:complete len:335 (-),score=40.90 GHVU01165965.1:279-1220(-)